MSANSQPMQSMADEFSETLRMRVDKFQHTRKVLSKLAHYKYTSKTTSQLARNIGLDEKIRNRLINDYFLIKQLNQSENSKKEKNKIYHVKVYSIPVGLLAKWMLFKDEFERIVLYYLYIECKNYEQISKEIIILSPIEVMDMQIKHVSKLCEDVLISKDK